MGTERHIRRLTLAAAGLYFLSVMGCALAPGLQLNPSPSSFADTTKPVDEGEYLWVPIDHQLVDQQVKAHPAGKRVVPPEWIKDDKAYSYQIGVGDLLQVVVWDHQELGGGIMLMPNNSSASATSAGASGGLAGSGVTTPGVGTAASANSLVGSMGSGFHVRPDGYIHFPYLGKIQAKGLSVEEVRDAIHRGLEKYIKDPQVEVNVAAYRSQKVHVSGEVTHAGDVPVTDLPLHLVDAVNAVLPMKIGTSSTGGASGGGLSTSGSSPMGADLDDIQVIRNGKTIKLSVYDVFKFGRTDENILLQDGDIVNVPSSDPKKIYVVGEIRNQGLRPLVQGKLTLEDAIQGSGGIIQESASDNKIMVFRQGKTKPTVYHMAADTPEALLLATKFPLMPGDVLYVGPANMTRVQRLVSSVMPVVQGASMGGAMSAGF